MPPKPKDNFKKLKDEWYSKLKESGFKDIEHADGSINSARPHALRTKHQVYLDSIPEYYNMCQAFLNDYEFDKEVDRVIWEYHTEGLSSYEIETALKKVGLKQGTNRIRAKIRKFTTLMKTRYLSA